MFPSQKGLKELNNKRKSNPKPHPYQLKKNKLPKQKKYYQQGKLIQKDWKITKKLKISSPKAYQQTLVNDL